MEEHPPPEVKTLYFRLGGGEVVPAKTDMQRVIMGGGGSLSISLIVNIYLALKGE